MKYFNESEFKRCSPSCEMSQCDGNSLARLDRAREVAGIPFVLSSAYRSVEYEKAKGRSGKGAHTEGKAFDIVCRDSRSRWRIVFGALAVGFKRIGIGKTFVHLDDSEKLDSPLIWLY